LRSRPDPAEEERLLKLFWNRAELKKELAGLDEELYQLKDRLKQQVAANDRAQEQVEQLEALLGTPERGFDALVHFGLRAVWRACRSQLEQFAQELRRQQEDRERRRQLDEFQIDRGERLKLADERLLAAVQEAEVAAGMLAETERRLRSLRGFWNYFRRHSLSAGLEQLHQRIASGDRHLADMREAHRTIEKEPLPEFQGLSVEGRRGINLAVIAYAGLLYQRLHVLGLAIPARVAMNRGVHDARHGTREACLARLGEIQRGLAIAGRQDGVVSDIRAATERMRAAVQFRAESDTIPMPESIKWADSSAPDAGRGLLIDDYWDVGRILLR
jgi:hypothetical protein